MVYPEACAKLYFKQSRNECNDTKPLSVKKAEVKQTHLNINTVVK